MDERANKVLISALESRLNSVARIYPEILNLDETALSAWNAAHGNIISQAARQDWRHAQELRRAGGTATSAEKLLGSRVTLAQPPLSPSQVRLPRNVAELEFGKREYDRLKSEYRDFENAVKNPGTWTLFKEVHPEAREEWRAYAAQATQYEKVRESLHALSTTPDALSLVRERFTSPFLESLEGRAATPQILYTGIAQRDASGNLVVQNRITGGRVVIARNPREHIAPQPPPREPQQPVPSPQEATRVVIEFLAPALNLERLVFEEKKFEDTRYQNALSETERIFKKNHEYINKITHAIVSFETYSTQPASERPPLDVHIAPDWDKSFDEKGAIELADETVQKQFPEIAHEFFIQEKTKVFENPQQDAIFTRIRQEVKERVEALSEFRTYSPLIEELYRLFGVDGIHQITYEFYFREFIRAFPEKAAVYATRDAQFGLLYQRVLEERRIAQQTTHVSQAPPPSPPTPAQKPAETTTEETASIKPTLVPPATQVPLTPPLPSKPPPPKPPEWSREYREKHPLPKGWPVAQPRGEREPIVEPVYIPTTGVRRPGFNIINFANRYLPRRRRDIGIPPPRLPGIGQAAGPAGNIEGGILKIATRGLMGNPVFWGLVGAGILILIIILFFHPSGIPFGGGGSTTTSTTGGAGGTGAIPLLDIHKSVDKTEANVGDLITYTINVTYSGPLDVTIYDPIPQHAEYVSASGAKDDSNKHEIKWRLKDNPSHSFTLTVKAIDENVYIVDKATARATGGGFCPSQSQIDENKKSPETCHYLNPGVNIFDTNFTEEQINSYINRYQPQSGWSQDTFAAKVRQIVSLAQSVGLNPVIPLGYWKTESGFSNGFGCKDVAQDFDTQVLCILGGPPSSVWSTKYADAPRCARDRDKNSPACQQINGRLTSPRNAEIFKNTHVTVPIQTFDDLAEMIGPRSPDLEKINCAQGDEKACKNPTNYNCTHTYNELLEIINTVGSCNAIGTGANGGSLAACTFRKSDQNPPDLPFKGGKLLGYFQEVSQKTGVPAEVLAAVARVESTTSKYTISNYTDSDVTAMENTSQIVGDIDKTIDGTKALCPRSIAGALGIMQVQPSEGIHTAIRNELLGRYGREQKDPLYSPENEDYNRHAAIKPFSAIGAHDAGAVDKGAQFIGKTAYEGKPNSLALQDYCDPKTSIYLAAGFILARRGGSWDASKTTDKEYIRSVATSYYGAEKYGSSGQYSYGDDLYNSITSCQAAQASTPGGSTTSQTSGLKDKIEQEFGIIMNGFDNQHFQWAYDTLKGVNAKAPKFLQLARMNNPLGNNIIINKIPRDTTQTGWRAWASFTPGCYKDSIDANGGANIVLTQDQDEPQNEIFTITLIHELGHMIQKCPLSPDSHFSEHENVFTNIEGGISFYSRHANLNSGVAGPTEGFDTWDCPDPKNNVSPLNEDYADMMAYYLLPFQQKNVCGIGRLPNPYDNVENSKNHKELVEKILGL